MFRGVNDKNNIIVFFLTVLNFSPLIPIITIDQIFSVVTVGLNASSGEKSF